MEAGERVNALGTKKLFPLIVSMSIPAICGNITTALYNVVDRLFVGQFVGRNALGAIGLMFPLNNVTSAITVLLTIGGGALISLSLGRKEKDKADEAFTNIVSMGAILAFIVTLFFFIFASQLISLCGARESSALHNPAVDYLRIIAIGQFFQIMNLGLAGAIRAEGNVRYSMVVSMIGALLNIGLDALFIIVFNAGLQGAAAATALSQVVGATVSALYFTRKKSVLRWAGLKSVRFKKMLEIAGLGAAPAVFQGFGLVNNLITNNSLMIYGNNEMGAGGGDLAISALSVVNTVESIALMVVLGMNNAISTIISYNYGAKQYKRTRNAALIGQAIAFVICTVVTFFLTRLMPGNPFSSDNISATALAQLNSKYGLDKPLDQQYLLYMKNLLHGDLGVSYKKTGVSVNTIIAQGLPNTVSLGLSAFVFSLIVGVAMGIWMAATKKEWVRGILLTGTTLGVSIPNFVFAILLMLVFGVYLKVLPATGLTTPRHYILPVLAMSAYPISQISRLVQSSYSEAMNQDYVVMAKAKGLKKSTITFKHILKNAILPVITIAGPMIAFLLTGSFVIENVFAIPGIGREFVNAISNRDYTIIMGMTIFIGAMIIVCNLLVDIISAVVDPRIKLSK